MAATEQLIVFLRANTSDFDRKFKASERQVIGFGASSRGALSKFAAVGGVALAAVAVGAVAVGVASIHAADDFEKSHVRLESAIKKIGSSWEAEQKRVTELDSKMEKLGFTNADTEGSLARLTLATGNVEKSTKLMGLAADISRARHIGLESATDLLVKVEGRRYLGLSKTLGVSKDVIAGFKDEGDAVKFLTDRFGGSAGDYTKTFAGKMEVLDATVTDLAKNIGLELIPVVQSLAGGVADGVKWLKENEVVAKALGVAIGAVLVPAMATFIALKVASAVSSIASAFSLAYTAVAIYGSTLLAAIPEAAGLIAANLGLAASEDAVAVSATAAWLAVAAPVVIIAGLTAGILAVADAFGYFDDNAAKVDTSAKALASNSLPQLAAQMRAVKKENDDQIRSMKDGNVSFDDSKLKTNAYKQVMQDFNKVLNDSPQFAQKFINAMGDAGFKTDEAKRKLAEHKDALRQDATEADAASLTQKRFADSLDGGTRALDAIVKPLNDAATLTKTYTDAVKSSYDAQFALIDANTQLQTDMADGSKTMEDRAKDVLAIAQASAELAVQQLGPGATAAQQQRAGLDAEIASLQGLAAQYPALKPFIDGFIGDTLRSAQASQQDTVTKQASITVLQALADKYPALRGEINQLIADLGRQKDATVATNVSDQAAITVLQSLAAKYPPLRAEIQALIGKLNDPAINSPHQASVAVSGADGAAAALDRFKRALDAVPNESHKEVTVRAGGFLLRAAGGEIPGFAAGGKPPPGISWVGEKGPELFVTKQGGRILSHADSMQAVANAHRSTSAIAVPVAARSGAAVINLHVGNVSIAPGHPLDMGAQLMDGLAAYVRANGAGALKKMVGV